MNILGSIREYGSIRKYGSTLYVWLARAISRAVASGPAGPTLVGPLYGSKMRECLDDS